MTLRHAAKRNIAKWVQTSHYQVRKPLVLGRIVQLATIVKGWPQMKLVTTKVMPSLLCIFDDAKITSNFLQY